MADETDQLNDQIRDAVSQMNALLLDDGARNIRAMSYQVMAHSIALSLYNTVHQQQQIYMLQNATTTAAIKEALKSNPADAIKLAQQAVADSDLTNTIGRLKTLLDELNQTYRDLSQEPAKPGRAAKAD